MTLLIIILLGLISATAGNKSKDICGLDPDPGTFFYFAYGSNLLSSRMHINCQTAKNCSAVKLHGWRLDFSNLTTSPSPRWHGAAATIVEDEDATVMGNLWQISNSESDKLDRQEGVYKHEYRKLNVTVVSDSGEKTTARTYVMLNVPPKVDPENIPPERQPSRTYLQVILLGAIECRIPVVHLEYIQRFQHNGRIAPNKTRKALGYPFYDDTFL